MKVWDKDHLNRFNICICNEFLISLRMIFFFWRRQIIFSSGIWPALKWAARAAPSRWREFSGETCNFEMYFKLLTDTFKRHIGNALILINIFNKYIQTFCLDIDWIAVNLLLKLSQTWLSADLGNQSPGEKKESDRCRFHLGLMNAGNVQHFRFLWRGWGGAVGV